MTRFGKVALLMGGRAGLGAAEQLVRGGARGRSCDSAAAEYEA